MTDRQRFVGSLAMPFIVHKEEEVQDFSADVSDTVLGITYMQTASDLQFLQKVKFKIYAKLCLLDFINVIS